MWQFLRNALQNESILNTEQKGRASWAILPGLDLLPRPPSSLSDVLAASQWKRLGPWLSESEQVLDNSLLSRPSSQAWEDYPNYPTWSKSAQSPSRVKTNLLIYKEGQRVGTDIFFFSPAVQTAVKRQRHWWLLGVSVPFPYSCWGARVLSQFLRLVEHGWAMGPTELTPWLPSPLPTKAFVWTRNLAKYPKHDRLRSSKPKCWITNHFRIWMMRTQWRCLLGLQLLSPNTER